jgi:chemotaxis protein MotA
VPLDLFIAPVMEGGKVAALSVHAGVWTSSALAATPDRVPRMRSQLEALMSAELNAKNEESDHPVHLLQMVGDSLPAIGIVAAVLGIINTMGAIADGPEAVGQKVAAALTGTLLGIFVAYGFVNPLANRIKLMNQTDSQYLRCILIAISSFAKGLAPLTAVEIARRSLDSSVQPNGEELEATLKSMPSGR